MKKKYSLILDDEFILFCELNDIVDVDKLAKETFKKGFDMLKYKEPNIVTIKKELPNLEIEKQPVNKNNNVTKNNLYGE
jgi:hypothetical protein